MSDEALSDRILDFLEEELRLSGHDHVIMPLREMADIFDVALSTMSVTMTTLVQQGKIIRHKGAVVSCYHGVNRHGDHQS